jgi:hypothetical protein
MVIRVEDEPTDLNLFLQRPILLFPISMTLSIFLLLLFYIFSETFSEFNFFQTFRESVEILSDTLGIDEQGDSEDLYSRARIALLKELSYVFLLGIIAGIFYLLFYFVVYVFLYIFFIFLFINFSAFNSAVTTSMLVSWFLLSIYIIIQKLKVEEIKTRYLDPHADYGITDRNIAIITSNEPPIICQGCRSYIAATLKVCSVCGDPIEDGLK